MEVHLSTCEIYQLCMNLLKKYSIETKDALVCKENYHRVHAKASICCIWPCAIIVYEVVEIYGTITTEIE